MAPASLVVKAQKFRRWYRAQVLPLFDEFDAILAPATPCTAPLIGQQTFMHGDVELPVRANLGLYTKPISFIGLPVVAAPVPLETLPIAVQIIVAPWREAVALRLAYALESTGVAAAMPLANQTKTPSGTSDGDRPARRRGPSQSCI
jgi:aspartyl-tRNA(Asn)/glutamyl-tRNA(Gln) amidotransferase subunit A